LHLMGVERQRGQPRHHAFVGFAGVAGQGELQTCEQTLRVGTRTSR